MKSDKEILVDELARWKSKYEALATGYEAKFRSQEELLRAADVVIKLVANPRGNFRFYDHDKFYRTLETYNLLNSKTKGPV